MSHATFQVAAPGVRPAATAQGAGLLLYRGDSFRYSSETSDSADSAVVRSRDCAVQVLTSSLQRTPGAREKLSRVQMFWGSLPGGGS